MPVKLTARASCSGCDWTVSGDPDTVDRAAEKHNRAGHVTATVTEPA